MFWFRCVHLNNYNQASKKEPKWVTILLTRLFVRVRLKLTIMLKSQQTLGNGNGTYLNLLKFGWIQNWISLEDPLPQLSLLGMIWYNSASLASLKTLVGNKSQTINNSLRSSHSYCRPEPPGYLEKNFRNFLLLLHDFSLLAWPVFLHFRTLLDMSFQPFLFYFLHFSGV